MKAVDTNVLARFILRDDEEQARRAEMILRQPVWIAETVLLELGWVLGRRPGMDRAVIARALETLLGLETVQTKNRRLLLWAISRFADGADWADMVHLVASSEAAGTFATFDRDVLKAAGPMAPIAIETLG